jgi:hypothetical protein
LSGTLVTQCGTRDRQGSEPSILPYQHQHDHRREGPSILQNLGLFAYAGTLTPDFGQTSARRV